MTFLLLLAGHFSGCPLWRRTSGRASTATETGPTDVSTFLSIKVYGFVVFCQFILFPYTCLYLFAVSPSVDAVIDAYDQAHHQEWRTYLSQFVNDNSHFWIGISLFRPLSRGTVRLASANPLDYPLIDPAYFSVPQDLVASVRTMSTGFQIMESEYLSPLVRYSPLPVPGCSFCTDGRPQSQCYSYLMCVLQTYTLTTYHPLGSNRMGNSSSTDAVVDERLRVLGVARLRVIDSSVMPLIPNANPNAATMMIAERGVDILREDMRTR